MTTATPEPRAHVVSPGVPSAAAFASGAAVVAVIAAALSSLATDAAWAPQVLGATLGAVVVFGFFSFGALAVDMVARVMPSVSLLIALLTYALQVVLLGVVFLALARSGATESAIDAYWLAGTVIGVTLAWTVGQVVGETRSRQLVFGSLG